jgi:glycine cleavage system H protein
MSKTMYTQEHEWLRIEEDGLVTVGITDYAQDHLGDLVFVQLPEAGKELAKGEEAAVIESVKAAGEINMPVAGVVTEVNGSLADEPGKVNEDPWARAGSSSSRSARQATWTVSWMKPAISPTSSRKAKFVLRPRRAKTRHIHFFVLRGNHGSETGCFR